MKILVTIKFTWKLSSFKVIGTGDSGGQDKCGEDKVFLVKLSCCIPVSFYNYVCP